MPYPLTKPSKKTVEPEAAPAAKDAFKFSIIRNKRNGNNDYTVTTYEFDFDGEKATLLSAKPVAQNQGVIAARNWVYRWVKETFGRSLDGGNSLG